MSDEGRIVELEVRNTRVLQIMPVPIGWHCLEKDARGEALDEPWRVLALALVDVEVGEVEDRVEPTWGGQMILPVGDDLHIYGLPGEGEQVDDFFPHRLRLEWRDE